MFLSLSANLRVLSAAFLGLALATAMPMSLAAQTGAQAADTGVFAPSGRTQRGRAAAAGRSRPGRTRAVAAASGNHGQRALHCRAS